jgi:hypothetical protein
LREREKLINEIGAHVVGVGERDEYQAKKLMDGGMPFDLLLDPEGVVREVLGSSNRLAPWKLLHPKGAVAYAKSLRPVGKFFDITMSQATQHPGVAVLDAQLNVTWSHIGDRLGDYPPVDVVLTELRRAL